MKNKYNSTQLMTEQNLKRIGVDFDGVIAKSIFPKDGIGEPVEGVREGLKKLKELGYNIVIYTARPSCEEISIELWCQDHDIPFDRIETGKQLFKILIDDRAFRFSGWDTDIEEIEKIIGTHKGTI